MWISSGEIHLDSVKKMVLAKDGDSRGLKITLMIVCTEYLYLLCASGRLPKPYHGMSGVFPGVKFNSKKLLFS